MQSLIDDLETASVNFFFHTYFAHKKNKKMTQKQQKHTKIFSNAPIAGGVRLEYLSKNGEEGYPGTLNVIVEYSLLENENTLEIRYIGVLFVFFYVFF